MNKSRLLILSLILFSWILIQPSLGRAAVSPHTKIKVQAGGPFVDMFSFSMPTPCSPSPCSEDRVVVAKYIVDNMTSDLNFELRATTLTKYNVTPFSTMGGGPVVTLMDNDGGVPAAYIYARFTSESATPNFRIIQIQVRFDNNYDAFPSGESWTIQATPSSGDDHYYGFWADGQGEAAVEAMVTKPHLINYIDEPQLTDFTLFTNFTSPTNVSFGDVHINLKDEYLPDEQYQFRNVGTKTLTITGASPISMPSSVYNVENYPSPPLPVLPMSAFSRRITCQPTELGAITDVNIGLTTDSSEVGTLNLNLINSNGVRLNAAILFDLSGSMLKDKKGEPSSGPAPAEEQKVRLARIAALEFSEMYKELLPEARLSLYTYPDRDGVCPSSEEMISQNEIKDNLDDFKNHLNFSRGHSKLIKPKDTSAKTPMADGIAKVYGKLSGLGTDERTAVFHFGDGQHNCPSTGARKKPEDWYNWPTFQNAGIPFFTIPYGVTSDSWLTTFTQLANKTNGEIFPADIDPSDIELQNQFKKALGKALDLETLQDPVEQINAGASVSHKVCVTESIHQLMFSVHWTVRNDEAIEVKVETPDHQFITPYTASTSPDEVSYVSGENYVGYVIRGNYLRGGNGSGQWKLHIKGNMSTPYAYQIYSMDRMKTEAGFNLDYIGQVADLVFKIKDGTKLIREAKVNAVYNMPTESFNNYLASTPIDPKLVFEAPEVIGEGPATLAQRKFYALTYFAKKPFVGKRRTGELKLLAVNTEAIKQGQSMLPGTFPAHAEVTVGKDMVFETIFKEAKYDGLYKVVIRVTGLTARGECFEREYSIARWADLRLSDKLIRNAVAWEDVRVGPYFDPELIKNLKELPSSGYLRKSIVFTPKDESGNFFGIGRASEITFNVWNAKAIGTIVDNIDGSYTQVIQYKKGTAPAVMVTVAGISSQKIQISQDQTNNLWVWVLVIIIIIGLVVVWLLIKWKTA